MRKEREESRNRENSLTPVHPDARKRNETAERGRSGTPPPALY